MTNQNPFENVVLHWDWDLGWIRVSRNGVALASPGMDSFDEQLKGQLRVVYREVDSTRFYKKLLPES